MNDSKESTVELHIDALVREVESMSAENYAAGCGADLGTLDNVGVISAFEKVDEVLAAAGSRPHGTGYVSMVLKSARAAHHCGLLTDHSLMRVVGDVVHDFISAISGQPDEVVDTWDLN